MNPNLTLDIFLYEKMKYNFYILECKNGSNYYGHTNDLKRRLSAHAKGNVYTTRKRRPIKLIYYEVLNSKTDAFRREMQFKNGRTRKKTIDKLIKEFPKEKCQGFNSRI